ncbi:MAG TPA: acetolactate synthase small subunit [Mobilitalea sp.]|nr:acetolactate synthase small subunit [Mobilitalea sp.]
MKKRWIALYVENDIGVLAKIAGLFAGKNYNLDSLTVGTTEDPSISRMTIGLSSDDNTFEQIKKQLNRCIEVIKVIDLTNRPFYSKEILLVKLSNCSREEIEEGFRIASVFGTTIVDYGGDALLMECVQTEAKNNDMVKLLGDKFRSVKIVRGGSAAIDRIN